jgi:hypothetical protein
MRFLVCLLLSIQAANATSLVKGIDAAGMSSVRQLALATLIYNENFKNGKIPKEAGPYPETPYGLVTHEILTQDDFQKLTQKNKITYFRPTLPDGDPDLPILYTRGEKTTILGFLCGQVASIPDPHKDQSHW